MRTQSGLCGRSVLAAEDANILQSPGGAIGHPQRPCFNEAPPRLKCGQTSSTSSSCSLCHRTQHLMQVRACCHGSSWVHAHTTRWHHGRLSRARAQRRSTEEPHANDKWPSHLLTLYLKILTYLSSVGQCHATSALRRTRPPAARPPVPAACTSRLHVACPPWPIRGPAEASIVVSTCMPSLAHTR